MSSSFTPRLDVAGGAVRRAFKAGLGALALAGALLASSDAARAEAHEGAPIIVAAFGDSLIHGYGLPIEDGFVPQLQAWLDANGAGPVVVRNAGVSGDTTSGGLARLDWSIEADVDAVIVELGGNDVLRGVDPAIARANLDAILARLDERGTPVLLAGMRALGNWGEEYRVAFEAIYPELAERHGVPLYPFFLEGVAGDPALNQEDGIHPNAEGVARIVASIGPSVLELIEAARARRAEDAG